MLPSLPDDGIVVVMGQVNYLSSLRRHRSMSTDRYLALPESMAPMELTHNVLREPPAPFYNHQHVIVRLTMLLAAHVTSHDIGTFCVSPIDVILDAEAGLVLQPDALVITHARRHIIGQRITGAPDLVIEVLSPTSAAYDRTKKRRWYRQYGVREYWMIHPESHLIIVVRHTAARSRSRAFFGDDVVRSAVLPDLCATADAFFQ